MINYEIFQEDLAIGPSSNSKPSLTKLKLFFYFEDDQLLQVRFEKDLSKNAIYKARPTFIKQFKDFYTGKKPFDYKQLSFKGTPFQIAVWKQILKISRGKTLSYGEIAECIGRPNAYRAVGTAVGKNVFGIIVPCHRVLHAGKNKVGKFAGGEKIKKALLHHEGVLLPD